MATVFVISEENHGIIGIAATRRASLVYLLESHWVDEDADIWWNPETHEYNQLKDLYGDNWRDVFLNFTNEDLENMGFSLREKELYTKE